MSGLTMNTNLLPPWGFMEEFVEKQLATRPIPEAWRDDRGATPGVREWMEWRDALADRLDRLLWPKYDADLASWSRTPSAALLDADFALLSSLHGQLDKPVRGLGETPVIHRVFFKEEDTDDIGFGAHYERYDPTVPQYLLANFTELLWNGLNRRLGSLHYHLKSVFLRPRPYQVAFLQKRNFHYVWAATGGTPSFISGHCVQSALGGASAFALFGSSVDIVSVDVLKQFTVDIGDRRVFAGVHYPSDNLGSWITALLLVPHVFDAAQVRPVERFLCDAILHKSIVFAAIKEHVASNRDSPYRPAVECLIELAGRCAGG